MVNTDNQTKEIAKLQAQIEHLLDPWERVELPENSNMVMIAIRGVGSTIVECRGCYTADWGKWYRAGGKTPVHALGWHPIIKWRE